jgi:hypothetical protein
MLMMPCLEPGACEDRAVELEGILTGAMLCKDVNILPVTLEV